MALENMERFGVPKHIVAFVLPTGYSFNLDGSTLYLSLASMFVAQAAGMHVPLGTAARDDADADADEQRRGGGAAGVAGDSGGDAGDVSSADGGHRGDAGCGCADGYGADIGECAGELPGDGGGGKERRGAVGDARSSTHAHAFAVITPSSLFDFGFVFELLADLMAALTALMFFTPSVESQSSSAFTPLVGVDGHAVFPGGAAAQDAGIIGAGFGGHAQALDELRVADAGA